MIRCDNVPELINHEFTSWSKRQGIQIEHIQPGKLQLANGFNNSSVVNVQ